MTKPQVITHKGKSIFYMDFSNLKKKEDIATLIDSSIAYIRSKPMNSIYTLTNITDMHFNNEIRDLFTAFVKGNKPYVKAGAVTGISGMQSIVYNAIMKITGRNIKSIKNLEEAKDWLANNA